VQKTILSAAILAASVGAHAQTDDSRLQSSPQQAQGLETLVVVASRSETPLRQVGTSVAVLDQEDIKLRGFPSLVDTLRSMPSVSVTNTGGMGAPSALRVRGESGFRTLVRVDGVDISDPTGTQAGTQMQHLLSHNVARVELLRGPQGMMYGADAGGVLDITTDRVDDGLRGGSSFESGRYNTRSYSGYIGGGSEQGDFYLSGARASTDGFNAHMNDESGDPDGYKNTTLHARGGWNFDPDLRAELVVRDTDAENEYDRCGFPDVIDDCIGFFEQRNVRASITHGNAAGENTLAYSQTEVSRTDIDGGVVSYDTEGEIAKWELNGRLELLPEQTLVYGIEHRSDQVLELERDQQGAYLEYQGAYADRFFVTAGLRYDDNDDFGGYSNYRLSAAYLVPQVGTGTLKLRSSVGTGFRAPSLFEIDYNRQQEAFELAGLQPEESFGFEVGAEYYQDWGLRLEAVLFDQRITDEIYFDLVDFSGYMQGEQESESRGLELVADTPLTRTLSLSANYTYVDTESDDGTPRSRQPKHLANLGLRYVPVDTLTLSVNWRTARDRREAGERLDNYQVIDASARYQVLDGMVVFIRGENIANEDYVEVPLYNTSGAAGYAGVELTF